MIKVRFKVHGREINQIIGEELELYLEDKANIIDVISEIDKIILAKNKFPSKDYGSLLHWVYNPVEERFYEQTAIHAYTKSNPFLNVRNDPRMKLPDNTTIILIPGGPCISAGDKPISYEDFKNSLNQLRTR
jgi:hypothetical protein